MASNWENLAIEAQRQCLNDRRDEANVEMKYEYDSSLPREVADATTFGPFDVSFDSFGNLRVILNGTLIKTFSSRKE